jgi:hypothetical protein
MTVYNFWYSFYFVIISGVSFAVFQPERLEQKIYLFLFLIYSTAISWENIGIMRKVQKRNTPLFDTILIIIPSIIVILLGFLWQEDSYDTNIVIGFIGTLFLGKYVLINSAITSFTKKIRWYYPIGYFVLTNSFWELTYLLGLVKMPALIQVFS